MYIYICIYIYIYIYMISKYKIVFVRKCATWTQKVFKLEAVAPRPYVLVEKWSLYTGQHRTEESERRFSISGREKQKEEGIAVPI